MDTEKSVRATFLVAAPDQPGLVARLAGFFYSLGLNILEASNHTDQHVASGARFYMRLVVDLSGMGSARAVAALGGNSSRRALETTFAGLVETLGGHWSVRYSDEPLHVAILATRDPTCLYDLSLRQRLGELSCKLSLVISNHAALEPVANSFQLPFFCLPVSSETRAEQEQSILKLLHSHHVQLVILARYMQVLSEEFLQGAPPVINIHHGFLPAFQGARPYHQAHARGVKIIGATAHYATRDLDQGPIIEQDVARVNHALGPEDMVRVGRDVERVVLARAVRAHLELRVIVEGQRTVIL